MAKVIKCDICGFVYDQYSTQKSMNVDVFEKKGEFGNGVYGCNEYDYCPDCTNKILEFIDVIKNNGDNYAITTYGCSEGKQLYLD